MLPDVSWGNVWRELVVAFFLGIGWSLGCWLIGKVLK